MIARMANKTCEGVTCGEKTGRSPGGSPVCQEELGAVTAEGAGSWLNPQADVPFPLRTTGRFLRTQAAESHRVGLTDTESPGAAARPVYWDPQPPRGGTKEADTETPSPRQQPLREQGDTGQNRGRPSASKCTFEPNGIHCEPRQSTQHRSRGQSSCDRRGSRTEIRSKRQPQTSRPRPLRERAREKPTAWGRSRPCSLFWLILTQEYFFLS